MRYPMTRMALGAMTALGLVIGVAAQATSPQEPSPSPAVGERPAVLVTGAAEAAQVLQQVQALTVDPAAMAREQAVNTVVRDAVKGAGRLSPIRPVREVTPRELAMAALERNLTLASARLQPAVTDQVLREAEALFDPTFAVSVVNSRTVTNTRTTQAYQWKGAAQFVQFGHTDQTGPAYACNRTDPGPNGQVGCWRVYNAAGSPVLFQEYDGPRAAGYRLEAVTGNQASLTGPTDTVVTNGTLTQRLPWGNQLQFGVGATYYDTSWCENCDQPAGAVTGHYGLPWVTSATLSLFIPLPYTRRFGVGDDADLNVRLSAMGAEASRLGVQALVNDTMLAVEVGYWTLVGATQQLQAAVDARVAADKLLEHTKRLYDDREITESDLAQVDSRVAGLRASAATALANVEIASNALHLLTHQPGDALLLPTGYAALLDRSTFEQGPGDALINNPRYQTALVQLRQAEATQETRDRQTYPDVVMIPSATASESSAVFGYKDLWSALKNLHSPDSVVSSLALYYQYPIGNRAAESASTQADLQYQRQVFNRDMTLLGLKTDYANALASLDSAHQSVAIASRNRALSDDVFERAQRFYALRTVTEYEIVQQLADALSARTSEILARVGEKQAEAMVLYTLGTLPSRYGERTAQTDRDRERVKILAASGELRHFGEMP